MARDLERERARKREWQKKYREANLEIERERSRAYHAANHEKARERKRANAHKYVQKNREYQRAYREANLEIERERSRAWYQANQEQLREKQRAYYASNSERVRRTVRNFVEKNKGSRSGPWTEFEVKILMRSDLTVVQRAHILDRSYQACVGKISRLRKQGVDI